MDSITTYPIVNKEFDNKVITYIGYVNWGEHLIVFTNNLEVYMVPTGRERSTPVKLNYSFPPIIKRVSACDEIGEFAILSSNSILFFNAVTGEFKRKMDFPNEDLVSCRVPRGTKILLVFGPKKLFFVDLDNFQIAYTEQLDLSSKEEWQFFFTGTDKFLTFA